MPRVCITSALTAFYRESRKRSNFDSITQPRNWEKVIEFNLKKQQPWEKENIDTRIERESVRPLNNWERRRSIWFLIEEKQKNTNILNRKHAQTDYYKKIKAMPSLRIFPTRSHERNRGKEEKSRKFTVARIQAAIYKSRYKKQRLLYFFFPFSPTISFSTQRRQEIKREWKEKKVKGALQDKEKREKKVKEIYKSLQRILRAIRCILSFFLPPHSPWFQRYLVVLKHSNTF